jgi:hypothetical protein
MSCAPCPSISRCCGSGSHRRDRPEAAPRRLCCPPAVPVAASLSGWQATVSAVAKQERYPAGAALPGINPDRRHHQLLPHTSPVDSNDRGRFARGTCNFLR